MIRFPAWLMVAYVVVTSSEYVHFNYQGLDVACKKTVGCDWVYDWAEALNAAHERLHPTGNFYVAPTEGGMFPKPPYGMLPMLGEPTKAPCNYMIVTDPPIPCEDAGKDDR